MRDLMEKMANIRPKKNIAMRNPLAIRSSAGEQLKKFTNFFFKP